jgi:hypothetical protein
LGTNEDITKGTPRRPGSPRGLAVLVLLGALSIHGPDAMAQLPLPPLPPLETSATTTTVEEAVKDLEEAVTGVEEAVKEPEEPVTEAGGHHTSLATGTPDQSASGGEPQNERAASIQPTRQPGSLRPRISVRKTNDADQDGTFSRAEDAPQPAADVPFRVEITNVGDGSVEIEKVSDSFRLATLDVCSELIGDRLAAGSTVSCTFELAAYAPPRFDSVANTISVVASAASDSGHRASERAVSTVTTPGNDDEAEVLGEQVTSEPPGAPNPPSASEGPRPALTGLYVLPLAAVALFLALSGALLIALGRRLERVAPVRG